MSDIGSRILQLLTEFPGDWEYASICHGLRHTPTGLGVAPSVPGRVLIYSGMSNCTELLSDTDHEPIRAVVDPVVERHRLVSRAGLESHLRQTLGLEEK